MILASVPELQKRTFSMAGKRSTIAAAYRASYRLGAPSSSPPFTASIIAPATVASE
jgi:hypothetical protein